MKLTANTLRSTDRLVQVVYTNGKYDYVRHSQLQELQRTKRIAYLA